MNFQAETTPTPTARFKLGSASDSIGNFSDLTGGTGVDVSGSVEGYSYAADYSSATTQLQLASADVTAVNAYTAFTVSFWFKSDDNMVLFCAGSSTEDQYDGLWIWVRDTAPDDLRVMAYDNGYSALFSLSTTTGTAETNPIYDAAGVFDPTVWHHFCLATDATGNHIYVDGVDVGALGTYSNGGSASFDYTPNNLSITPDSISLGAAVYASNPNNRLCTGAFSDLRIWNSRLTTTQIETLYAETVPRYLVIGTFGQSNSMGYNDLDGGYDQSAGGVDAGNRRILQWGRGYTAATATGTYNPSFQDIDDGAIGPGLDPFHNNEGGHDGIGPMLTFAKHILPYIPDNYSILIVPAGKGSTGFSTDIDSVGGEYVGDWIQGGTYYEDAKDRYLAALATNSTYNIAGGFVWNQRESDANAGEAPNYETHLGSFVDNMRSDIAISDLLILMSGPTDDWIDEIGDASGYKATVKQATIDVCEAKANCFYIPTTGLPSEYDQVLAGGTSALVGDSLQQLHMSADGQRKIGERYAEAFTRMSLTSPVRYYGHARSPVRAATRPVVRA